MKISKPLYSLTQIGLLFLIAIHWLGVCVGLVREGGGTCILAVFIITWIFFVLSVQHGYYFLALSLWKAVQLWIFDTNLKEKFTL